MSLERIYEYKITARLKGNTSTALYIYRASTMQEAKGLFKASFQDAQIVSCVKGREVSQPTAHHKSQEPAQSQSSLAGLAGIALGVGALLAKSLFKK